MTIACFQSSGITVSFSDFLNSRYNGYVISSCVSINNFDVRPSGPIALSGLSLERALWTDSTSNDSTLNYVYFDLNILKGSLQPKLKAANVWPFNARGKVARGWVYHTWSLYRYCKEKIDQTQLQWHLGQFLRAPAGPGRFLGLT